MDTLELIMDCASSFSFEYLNILNQMAARDTHF